MAGLDSITNTIASLSVQWITTISLIVDHHLAFGVMLFLMTILSERRPAKLRKIFLGFLLALLLSYSLARCSLAKMVHRL